MKDEANFLQLHQDYRHVSFYKLQLMAKQGILPARFASCNIPAYSACMCGAMTKKNWRSKPKLKQTAKLPLKPGDVTLVDMLVSRTPGLIAQMTLILTKK